MTPDQGVLLDRAAELGRREDGLSVITTLRRDGSPHASVVNAGVLVHPVTGARVVGLVVRGGALKLTNMRNDPRTTVLFRSGWEWVAVDGRATILDPRDPDVSLDVPTVACEIYAAAVGGQKEEWAELESTMTAERHTPVLIQAHRVYSSPA